MAAKLRIAYDASTQKLLASLERLLRERTKDITSVLLAEIYRPPGAAGIVKVERLLDNAINRDPVIKDIKYAKGNLLAKATPICYSIVEEDENHV